MINGPNLNLLGTREPEIYGTATYGDLEEFVSRIAAEFGVETEMRQTNHEGTIVDWIHESAKKFDALVLNAAAYTHTSVAILDALRATRVKTVEVHLTEPKKREEFRKVSFVEPAAIATCSGKGFESYADAIRLLAGR